MKIKQKKGISLIVLVITIVVMIILATVVILSLDSSNIIERANAAKEATNLANAKEIVAIAKAEWQLDEDTLSSDYASISEYVSSKLEEAGYKMGAGKNSYVVSKSGNLISGGKNTIYIDSNNDFAVIPEGFVVSGATGENTVEYGLVIYAGTEPVTNQNVNTAKTTRNQFVWIPIDDISKFKRTTTYDGTITDPGADFSEPYKTLSLTNDPTGEWAEYTAMKESVKNHGGFYIGRYEAGTSVQREYEMSNGTSSDVLVQKNKFPYNNVAWGPSMTKAEGNVTDENGYNQGKGAVELSRSLYSTEYAQSTLCYGVQWDAALTFITTRGVKDTSFYIGSSDKGNFEGRDNTGANDNFSFNNIYDLAGNVLEITMECFSNSRVFRGGTPPLTTTLIYPIYNRSSLSANTADSSSAVTGFRVALYVK